MKSQRNWIFSCTLVSFIQVNSYSTIQRKLIFLYSFFFSIWIERQMHVVIVPFRYKMDELCFCYSLSAVDSSFKSSFVQSIVGFVKNLSTRLAFFDLEFRPWIAEFMRDFRSHVNDIYRLKTSVLLSRLNFFSEFISVVCIIKIKSNWNCNISRPGSKTIAAETQNNNIPKCIDPLSILTHH